MKMLEVNDLTTEFSTENGTVKAVRDVSFYVDKGEVLELLENQVLENHRRCSLLWDYLLLMVK